MPSMETLYYSTWQSPIGPLTLIASERGLVALEFRPQLQRKSEATGSTPTTSSPLIAASWKNILRENCGTSPFPWIFAAPISRCVCWHALLKIPYGQTRTYADQARAVGRPKAFRAVGLANHDNPIAIIVPCHRVIASDGTLGGYGGGLALKQKLLDLECGQAVLLPASAAS